MNEIANEISNIHSSGDGLSLDRGTKGFMEARFNCDFSIVRIYYDVRAAKSTRSVNSLAFTFGNISYLEMGSSAQYFDREHPCHKLTYAVQED